MLHSLYICLSFILFYDVPNGSLLPPSNLLRSVFIFMKGRIAQLFVSHPVITICHIHHTSSGVYVTPFILKLNLCLWKAVTCIMRENPKSPLCYETSEKQSCHVDSRHLVCTSMTVSTLSNTIYNFSFHVAFGWLKLLCAVEESSRSMHE